jgi:glycosyltransferase involved in cell wall biosynthesis
MQKVSAREVLIIDSAQTDELLEEVTELLHSRGTEVLYMHQEIKRNEWTMGIRAARNVGAQLATGDVILFLDDDVVLDSDYLSSILAVYEQDASGQVGGVCGVECTRESKGRFFSVARNLFARIIVTDSKGGGEILPSGYTSPHSADRFCGLSRVDWLPGYNMSFRRSILRRFRFNEVPAGSDDLEFSHEVSREYMLFASPRARIWHMRPHAGRSKLQQRVKHDMRDYDRFFALYYRRQGSLFLHCWSNIGFVLGAALSLIVNPSEGRLDILIGAVNGLSSLLKNASVKNPQPNSEVSSI